MKKCSETNMCDFLSERITGLASGGKGFNALYSLETESKKQYFVGVVYRLNKKDKGLMLNFCPFCGCKPGNFK